MFGAYVCELIEGYVKLRFTHADIEVYESEVEVYARGIEVWQVNPEKPDVPLNKNDAFQKVQKRRVQEKR